MIESSAVVACPIGANRYVGVWHSVPLSKDDLQGRILRRRRHQRVAEHLRLDVGQRCANSAMHARWRFSAGRAICAVLKQRNAANTVTAIFERFLVHLTVEPKARAEIRTAKCEPHTSR